MTIQVEDLKYESDQLTTIVHGMDEQLDGISQMLHHNITQLMNHIESDRGSGLIKFQLEGTCNYKDSKIYVCNDIFMTFFF